MANEIINPNVTLVNGTPMVTSLEIAEKFEKPHKDVLTVLRKLMEDLPQEFIERNFSPNEYTDSIGRKLPMYQLTRDAFSLLAMGFTGKKALAWKVRYIEAFNVMEAELFKKAESGKKRIERKTARTTQNQLPCAFQLNISAPEPGDKYYAYLEKVEAWRIAALNEREKLYREGVALLEADRIGTMLFHSCSNYISQWLEHDVLSPISLFDKFLDSRRAPVNLAKFLNGSSASVAAYLK